MADYYHLDTRRKWHRLSVKEADNAPGGLTSKVYPASDRTLAKIYRSKMLSDPGARETLLQKIIVMSFKYESMGNLRGTPLGWPLGPLFSRAPESNTVKIDSTAFCGYLMPRMANTSTLDRVFTDTAIGSQKLSDTKLITIARKISEITAICHQAGFIIGDLNQNNFLVSGETLDPGLIDCDSFQFRHRFESGVERVYTPNSGTLDYSSPALLDRVGKNANSFVNVLRVQEDDEFALGVLIFQILMKGVHPFDTLKGSMGVDKIAENIRLKRYPYAENSQIEPPKFADRNLLQKFSPEIRELFARLFERGGGVQAKEWVAPLMREASLWHRIRRALFG